MSDPLKIVNAGLSLVQLIEASVRIQGLVAAAIANGMTHVTMEEMQAAVGNNDAAMATLRAAIERAEK